MKYKFTRLVCISFLWGMTLVSMLNHYKFSDISGVVVYAMGLTMITFLSLCWVIDMHNYERKE